MTSKAGSATSAPPLQGNPDYLFLFYGGTSQISKRLPGDQGIVGSSTLLPELRQFALAKAAAGANIAICTQGPERETSGEWNLKRWVNYGGVSTDCSQDIFPVSSTVDPTTLNLMSEEVILKFLLDMGRKFPQAKHLVVGWGLHGGGIGKLGVEQLGKLGPNAPLDLLSFDKFVEILKNFTQHIGRPIDFTIFSACVMGQVEAMLPLLNGVTRLGFVSPTLINTHVEPGTNRSFIFPVVSTLEQLAQDTTIPAQGVGEILMAQTVAHYETERDKALAAGKDEFAYHIPSVSLVSSNTTGLMDVLEILGVHLTPLLDDLIERQKILCSEAKNNRDGYEPGSVHPVNCLNRMREAGVRGLDSLITPDDLRKALKQMVSATFVAQYFRYGVSLDMSAGDLSMFMPPALIVSEGWEITQNDSGGMQLLTKQADNVIVRQYDFERYLQNIGLFIQGKLGIDVFRWIDVVEKAYGDFSNKVPREHWSSEFTKKYDENDKYFKALFALKEHCKTITPSQDSQAAVYTKGEVLAYKLVGHLHGLALDFNVQLEAYQNFQQFEHDRVVLSRLQDMFSYYERCLEPLFEIPHSWKEFLLKLSRVTAQEVLPELFRQKYTPYMPTTG